MLPSVLLRVRSTSNNANGNKRVCYGDNDFITSHKKFSEGKQTHVGMEALKTNQTRWESMTPQHFHTIPTSCGILPPLAQICYVFVSLQRRVVEGIGVGSGGCVVHGE